MRVLGTTARVVATVVAALALVWPSTPQTDAGAPRGPTELDRDAGHGHTPLVVPDAPVPPRFSSSPMPVVLPPRTASPQRFERASLVAATAVVPSPRRIQLPSRGPRAPPVV